MQLKAYEPGNEEHTLAVFAFVYRKKLDPAAWAWRFTRGVATQRYWEREQKRPQNDDILASNPSTSCTKSKDIRTLRRAGPGQG